MNIILPLEIVNNMPWIWLGVAIVMTIIEGLTMGLTTIWLAISALISMILAFFIPLVSTQIIIFLILSLLFLFTTRPLAVKKMKLGQEKTNADRLVGMNALVMKAIGPDEPGQVKVSGQIWTARAENPRERFAEKDHAAVIRIEGVTLIVGKKADPEPLAE